MGLYTPNGWLGSRTGLGRRRALVQIAAATLSGNSLGQTVQTIICIALVLRLGHATGGARVFVLTC